MREIIPHLLPVPQSRPLTFTTPFKYAGEAVMGFCILHQTLLLVNGYSVVQWAVPDLAEWVIVLASSFVVIMAICEVGALSAVARTQSAQKAGPEADLHAAGFGHRRSRRGNDERQQKCSDRVVRWPTEAALDR